MILVSLHKVLCTNQLPEFEKCGKNAKFDAFFFFAASASANLRAEGRQTNVTFLGLLLFCISWLGPVYTAVPLPLNRLSDVRQQSFIAGEMHDRWERREAAASAAMRDDGRPKTEQEKDRGGEIESHS